jgi:hypothetical protein
MSQQKIGTAKIGTCESEPGTARGKLAGDPAPISSVCPKCGQKAFRAVKIHSNFYTRKCLNCQYDSPHGIPLPQIRKKVIYLDQLAISEMLKSLDPSMKRHPTSIVKPLWRPLYDEVLSACRHQLAICPGSEIQAQETSAYLHGDTLRHLVGALSHGVAFRDWRWVRRVQLCAHAEAWARGVEPDWSTPDATRVTNGTLHAWWSSLTPISRPLNSDILTQSDDTAKCTAHAALAGVWQRWRSQAARRFRDFMEEEVSSAIEDIVKPTNKDLWAVRAILEDSGIPKREAATKAVDCLRSPGAREVPQIRIFSALVAGAAYHAARGNQRQPDPGDLSDIEMFAAYVPYCDLMVVDRFWHDVVSRPPVSEELKNLRARLHKARQISHVLSYVQKLNSGASDEHKALVKELYGAW